MGVDLRYRFPCADLPRAVRDGLEPWFIALLPLTSREVVDRLADRWRGLPEVLQPLARALRAFDAPALVAGDRAAYVELTAGDPRRPVAWEPRSWLPTPWRFDLAAARRFLAARGDGAHELDDDEVEDAARDVHAADDDDDGDDRSVYVVAPCPRAEVERRLRSAGLAVDLALVTDFVVAYGGLAESEPGTCGSISRADELEPDDVRVPDRAWRGALPLFTARNGDRVLLQPASGALAWHAFAEGKVKPRWRTIGDLVRSYAEHLPSGEPFDSYSAAS